MIKANELRIGSLLAYASQIVHITSISLEIDDEYESSLGFCRLGEHANEKGGVIDNLTNLNPIPLTLEWLERCGF